MTPNTKRLIALIALGIGVFLVLTGFGKLVGSMGNHTLVIKGLVYFLGGMALALPAAVMQVYYRQKQSWLPPQEKIDVETLAAMAKQKRPPVKK